MTEVTSFAFEAAHWLSNYEGECGSLHGHSYHGTIAISGVVVENGMLIDFKKVKEVIKDYDHAFIYNSRDEEQLWLTGNPCIKKSVEIDGPTTAENIATQIAHSVHHLGRNISIVRVTLYETANNCVSVTYDEMDREDSDSDDC